MKRRGYDFARSTKLKAARSEEADYTIVAPKAAAKAAPEAPAAKRAVRASAAKDTCETPNVAPARPSRLRSAAPRRASASRELGLTSAQPYENIDIHGIIPVGQMPNGTIKASINETTIYISATVNPKPGAMVATYRLAGKYFGLSAEQYARVKGDCPATKTPTEAELALRKIKIMFAHAETLINNQGEYFRTVKRAEQARADWEAKYPEKVKKSANAEAAKAMTKKWTAKDATQNKQESTKK